MRLTIVAAQAAVTLLMMATPAKADGMNRDVLMPPKECSAILAGMANDARIDDTVSVEYDGVSLSLEGRGRSYSAWCKNGRIFFSGSYCDYGQGRKAAYNGGRYS